jgi:iron complex outermembrane recepter protein
MALTLGGRYQTETRDLGPSETRIAIPGSNDASEGIPFSSFPPQRSDSSNFSPKAVLDFKLADDALVYLLYAKGYKSGTYNIVNIVQPAEYVKPEIVDSYELGYKDTLFDGSMRLSAAVFENRAENVQGQIISFLSGGLAALLNNGNSRIRGAEVEGAWQPLPNSLPGLALTGATSWLDGVYTSYPDGTGYDETTGLYFGRGSTQPGRDFSGNRTVRTPKWSGNLGLSYAFALGRGTAEIAGDAYYNSGIYYSAQNNAESREDSYTVVGARASYLFEPWNLRATAFGTNLTDARYYLFLADSDFATGGLLAPQAVYGLRLNWQF